MPSPSLVISPLYFDDGLSRDWIAKDYRMLKSSTAYKHIKDILLMKVGNKKNAGVRFFGESFVACAKDMQHDEGYYGSFKWLTNHKFRTDDDFPKGPTREYKEQLRTALQKYFGSGQLRDLQTAAHAIHAKHGKKLLNGQKPVPPDLWLVSKERHRFIEAKLPRDWVEPHQVAGLALISCCLNSPGRKISVEIVEVRPKLEDLFGEISASINAG